MPLVISVAALVWIFDVVDGVMAPLYDRLLGRHVPGLGLLTTLLLVLLAGVVATNVIGRRLLRRAEHYLMLVPVFRTIYAPVKQLILAFSPDNESGFKRVVLVERSEPRQPARLPDPRVHRADRRRRRPTSGWRRSTCRPITSIWGTS